MFSLVRYIAIPQPHLIIEGARDGPTWPHAKVMKTKRTETIISTNLKVIWGTKDRNQYQKYLTQYLDAAAASKDGLTHLTYEKIIEGVKDMMIFDKPEHRGINIPGPLMKLTQQKRAEAESKFKANKLSGKLTSFKGLALPEIRMPKAAPVSEPIPTAASPAGPMSPIPVPVAAWVLDMLSIPVAQMSMAQLLVLSAKVLAEIGRKHEEKIEVS